MEKKNEVLDFCLWQKLKIKALVIKSIRENKPPYLIKKAVLGSSDFRQKNPGVCQERIVKSLDRLIWQIWNQEQKID